MAYLKFWREAIIGILVLLLVLCFTRWQSAREEVGGLKAEVRGKVTEIDGLRNQLSEANKRITQTANAGAVSYGQCQDLAANDASVNFDKGVSFGRATCPSTTSSVSPVVRDLHSRPASTSR